MAKEAKSALKAGKLDVIADRGYFNGAELLTCHKDGITATVPRPETSGNRKKGMFVKADFIYDAEADTYTCPAGKALTYRYTREERGLMHRRYWQNDCQHCRLKARCTTGKERRITRWEHEHLIEAMYARMDETPDLMRTRRSTVEHPFGTIKAWMGATHFQMRRMRNVRTEMALHVLAYNIKRMINMIGVGSLLKAMTAYAGFAWPSVRRKPGIWACERPRGPLRTGITRTNAIGRRFLRLTRGLPARSAFPHSLGRKCR